MLSSEVARAVVARATRPTSTDHGEQHWKAVAWTGLMLADEHRKGTVDREVVLLFALFHDSQRWNEYVDPGHGIRGGEFAARMAAEGAFDLSGPRLEKLVNACSWHDEGGFSKDRTIGVCWDADRLNLWRIGIEPNPQLLSTLPARLRIDEAQQYPWGLYKWDDLFASLANPALLY